MDRIVCNAVRRAELARRQPNLLPTFWQPFQQLSCLRICSVQQQQIRWNSMHSNTAAATVSATATLSASTPSTASPSPSSSNSSSVAPSPPSPSPSVSPSSGVWVTNPAGRVRRQILVPRIPKTTSFLIVLQEWWGIVPQIEQFGEKLAFEGYNVVIPDLYRGRVGATVAEAAHLLTNLNFQQAVSDVGFVVNEIRQKNPTAKIATVGFSLGGALSLACASILKENEALNAALSFYGIPDLNVFNLSQISIPVQCHFAELDSQAGFSDPNTVDKLELLWKKTGKTNYEIHRLAGVDHAFLNNCQPWADQKRKEMFFVGGYQKRIAEATWNRTFQFLKTNIF